MKSAPKLPKGTRDFSPEVMLRRNFIIDTIKSIYEKYGFQPLETPAMENLSVLMGKYGEEGDTLLYKILDSGDFLKKANEADKQNASSLLSKISEKGLRYDLTVPFARFVAANKNELNLPFKRYQIQPVWRADRPQPNQGRYREFYQCDADVVGTNSLICELEIIQIINEVLPALGVENFSIKINHREILRSISQWVGKAGNEADLAVAIDKIDKIGWDGVQNELKEKGFDQNAIDKIGSLISIEGNIADKIKHLTPLLLDDNGKKGLSDLETLMRFIERSSLNNHHLSFDLSLARGLSYYTGIIFEVIIPDTGIGSVSGGGRYDNLTEVFGVKDSPGVGFSFGIDRLYDCMAALGLFEQIKTRTSTVLLVHFDETSLMYGLELVAELRKSNIAAELYPDLAKLKKQIQYADKKNIPYVLFIGSNEIESGIFNVKNLANGEEQKIRKENLNEFFSLFN